MTNRRADDGENFQFNRDHIHGAADDHPIYYERHKQTYLFGRFGRYFERHERGIFWSVVGSALAAFGVVITQ